MHCHCSTNNRAPRWTFTDPCKPEVRPGAWKESASPAWLAAPAMNARDTTKVYIWKLDTGCGLTLYRKCHSHNTQGKTHNNTWVEPLAGNCTNSSNGQREQVWQKCKIQNNWCTVTAAPTIEYHGGIHGPLQTRGETRCPGGVSVPCLAICTRHECMRQNERVYMEAWHWMWTGTILEVSQPQHTRKNACKHLSRPPRGELYYQLQTYSLT